MSVKYLMYKGILKMELCLVKTFLFGKFQRFVPDFRVTGAF